MESRQHSRPHKKPCEVQQVYNQTTWESIFSSRTGTKASSRRQTSTKGLPSKNRTNWSKSLGEKDCDMQLLWIGKTDGVWR
jgi:hypothetical protein